MTRFSIIIPTYNRDAFLGKAIESVLKQSCNEFELIIIDDGSTDNTSNVVKSFSDPRIRYFKTENQERGAARNYGASLATGKYLNFFDSDDLLYPNHLAEANNMITDLNDPEWFHLGYEIRTPNGDLIKTVRKLKSDENIELIHGNFLSCNGVFIRKDIAELNRFNEDRTLSALEDWELWLRLATQYKLYLSNKVTSVIIDHESRSVMTINKEKLIQRFDRFIELISANKNLTSYYNKYLASLYCSCYTYISLHLALTKRNKKDSLNYLLKGIRLKPAFLLERRFFAILKHLVL